MQKYLECAKIVNTHGVRGAVMLEIYMDSPEIFTELETVYCKKGGAYTPVKILTAVPHKRMVLATLDCADSLEAAIPLKGTVLYADREDIPLDDGDHFIADLVGLPVTDAESGEVYGTLKNVINAGAHDIYVVKRKVVGEDGEEKTKEFMIPAVDEFIKRISVADVDGGIFVSLLEGMLD